MLRTFLLFLIISLLLVKLTALEKIDYPYSGTIKKMNPYLTMQSPYLPLEFNSCELNEREFIKSEFRKSHFNCIANFSKSHFSDTAKFEESQFNQFAKFNNTTFNAPAFFENVTFTKKVIFNAANFIKEANFYDSKFVKSIEFNNISFDTSITFENVSFSDTVYFKRTKFYSDLNLKNIKCIKEICFDFSLSQIMGPMYIGNSEESIHVPIFDFSRTHFLDKDIEIRPPVSDPKIPERKISYPGARIILTGLVNLNLQREKFKYLQLAPQLDYYKKKDIISYLKTTSYKGENYKNERYELDYLFAKSTMYQEASNKLVFKNWYKRLWPKFFDCAMGLGYKPLKIIFYWIIPNIILFFLIYASFFSKNVIQYYKDKTNIKDIDSSKQIILLKNKIIYTNKKYLLIFDKYLHCLYFSGYIFFSLKPNIYLLTFFSSKWHKLLIFLEWFFGFATYIAIIILSEEGSVIHSLRIFLFG